MTDNSKKQPLSYEPLKSIFAKMNLKTRENIALRMPSHQKTNEVVPYPSGYSAYFIEQRTEIDHFDLHDRCNRRSYTNIEIEDLPNHLDNKHLLLEIKGTATDQTDQIGIDLVQNLARHWLNTEKQVGSTFTLPHHDFKFIADVLFEMKEEFGARITRLSELGDDVFADCAVIPMNDNLEIVAFGTRYGDGTGSEGVCDSKFALKMTIRIRGSTSLPGFFE